MTGAAGRHEPGAILARWPGTCPACWRPIERGDYLLRRSGSNAWVHEACRLEEDKRAVGS